MSEVMTTLIIIIIILLVVRIIAIMGRIMILVPFVVTMPIVNPKP